MEYKTPNNIKIDSLNVSSLNKDSQNKSQENIGNIKPETMFFLYENLYLLPIQAKFNGIDLGIKLNRLPFEKELEIYCSVQFIREEKDLYKIANMILLEVESYTKIDNRWYVESKGSTEKKEIRVHDVIGVNNIELCIQFYVKNMTSIMEVEELSPLFPKVDDKTDIKIGIKNKLMFFNLYRKACFYNPELVNKFNFNILTLWDKLNKCEEAEKLGQSSYSQLISTATGFGAKIDYDDYFNKLQEISKGNMSGETEGVEKKHIGDLLSAVEEGKREQASIFADFMGKSLNERIEYMNSLKNKEKESQDV